MNFIYSPPLPLEYSHSQNSHPFYSGLPATSAFLFRIPLLPPAIASFLFTLFAAFDLSQAFSNFIFIYLNLLILYSNSFYIIFIATQFIYFLYNYFIL